MTVVDVDTDVYQQAADALIAAADNFYLAVDKHWPKLAETGESMCGSYEEARTWATGYDTKANDLLTQVRALAQNVNGYGNVLHELAWLHALGDHNANMKPGPPPGEPAVYPSLADGAPARPPLPSAGGPGEGLVEDGIGLLSEIGITVPDGDTDKLWTVAAIWRDIAAESAVAGLADEIKRVAGMFTPITAPELDHIDEDLRVLAAAAGETVLGFGAMATTTGEHHDALQTMRKEIEDTLRQFVIDSAVEVAVTGVVTIAASFITFGAAAPVGAAIGASRLAALCAKYGPKIRPFIAVFKSRGLGRGFKDVPDFSGHKAEMDRIWQMINKKSPTGRRPTGTNWSLTPEDIKALQDGQMPRRPDGTTLNQLLFRGTPLSPEEQAHVRALNEALGKLPSHEGPVVRHMNLTPEQLARYEPGKPITENGFTSTSLKPDGANPAFADTQNVEFQIVSKTGKPVGEYSGMDDEVLFASGTPFMVRNSFPGPDGKWIVQMTEI
ncbi:hypothetical protein IU448_08225 [Nocardia flavorosea]|uniref:hypothetical protein n=1 Tax=Nocardia flavorosea TaxID=53429 RepID=UPI00189301AA|nr:hypothetical protein [Nocardia flavorosea]MBF6349006.1 hypothetical protein [Nocardia flavorosea]